jgi:hypothetical protein
MPTIPGPAALPQLQARALIVEFCFGQLFPLPAVVNHLSGFYIIRTFVLIANGYRGVGRSREFSEYSPKFSMRYYSNKHW